MYFNSPALWRHRYQQRLRFQ